MAPRISTQEYRDRLTKLRNSLSVAELDLFIVSSMDSIYYLTGAVFEPLERPFFLLVRPHDNPVLLVPMLEYEHMKKAHNVNENEIKTYREYPAPKGQGWPETIHGLVSDARRIGVEPSLPQAIFNELHKYSPTMLPLIEQLRLIKSPMEVEMIRRAAGYADLGVEQLIASSVFNSSVVEGFIKTRHVTARIIRDVQDWEPLSTKVLMATWAAPRSSQPHSIPRLSDRLRTGPHVGLALTRVNGYAAESERTYFTADPSPRAKEMFEAMIAARDRALAMIRPGVYCGEIDAMVNEFLTHKGFGEHEQRLHRTGHGIGLGTHEGPWIAEGSDDILAENMVVSIEPGIYVKEEGGVRHSDTVLVTKDGHEALTKYPRDLDQLTIKEWRPILRFKGWVTWRRLGIKSK